MRERLAAADRLAVSVLGYVEARSAFARRRRAGDLSAADHRTIVRDLDGAWDRYVTLEVTGTMIAAAVPMTDRHGLRAYDAVHLASASLLRKRLGTVMLLASWDDELDAAAAREGFQILRHQRH